MVGISQNALLQNPFIEKVELAMKRIQLIRLHHCSVQILCKTMNHANKVLNIACLQFHIHMGEKCLPV